MKRGSPTKFVPVLTDDRLLEDAVAYRFITGQSLDRIRRIYRLPRRKVEDALRAYGNRIGGK